MTQTPQQRRGPISVGIALLIVAAIGAIGWLNVENLVPQKKPSNAVAKKPKVADATTLPPTTKASEPSKSDVSPEDTTREIVIPLSGLPGLTVTYVDDEAPPFKTFPPSAMPKLVAWEDLVAHPEKYKDTTILLEGMLTEPMKILPKIARGKALDYYTVAFDHVSSIGQFTPGNMLVVTAFTNVEVPDNTELDELSITVNFRGKLDDESSQLIAVEKMPPGKRHRDAMNRQVADKDLSAAVARDQAALLGSWKIITTTVYGALDKESGGKVVFSADGLLSHPDTVNQPFRLNPLRVPKQLDYGRIAYPFPARAIYEISGDELRFCWAYATALRPTTFDVVGDTRFISVVCKRAPSATDAPLADQGDPKLTEAIQETIDLLEAKQFETALEKRINPDLFQDPEGKDASTPAEALAKVREPCLSTLRALLKMTPKLKSQRMKATFDLATIHIENGLPYPDVRFIRWTKTKGVWQWDKKWDWKAAVN